MPRAFTGMYIYSYVIEKVHNDLLFIALKTFSALLFQFKDILQGNSYIGESVVLFFRCHEQVIIVFEVRIIPK